jgi:hypothetical protein
MTGLGALQSAPQLRERLLRRIGSWSWNDEVGSNHGIRPEPRERPLPLPIARKLPFRFRPGQAIDRMTAFQIARPGADWRKPTHHSREHP